MDALPARKILLGRFALDGQIGRGGMGEVFRAIDQRTGKPVAIKTLRIDDAAETHSESNLRRSLVQRFKREYRVASRLDHPGCVRSHLLASVGGDLLFAMDYCGGPSLRAFTRTQSLQLPDALELALQLLDGLDYIHSRNIVHRDLKPANLLLDAPWTGGAGASAPRVRITDFGIARIGDLSDERQVGQILGTNAYLAPECIQGAPSDPRVDLYAFGIILFELLTGRHPLAGPSHRKLDPHDWLEAQLFTLPRSAREILPELPEELDALLLDLLEKDPTRRPRTAALVHDALTEIAKSHGLLRPEPPSPGRTLEGSPYIAAPRFVGRRRELTAAFDFLRDAFTPSVPHPARAMLIEGEAGSGKSRLLEELLSAERRARALVGQCRPYDGRLFECMSGLIEVLLPMLPARPVPDRAPPGPQPTTASAPTGELDETRPLNAAADAAEETATRALPDQELLPRTATGLLQRAWSNRQNYERIKGNLADAFLALCRRRPVLVVIEDAQWMDLESLDLLAYLMKRVRDAEAESQKALPVAFVITARPATDENRTHAVREKVSASIDAVQGIALSAVGEDVAEELARHMLMLPRAEDAREIVRRVLHGRSASPLFLIQVLQLLLLGGELTRGQVDARGRWTGRWNLDLDPGALTRLPLTLQDAIGERAARLSVETHALLEVAAVMGTRVELELIRGVLGLHRNQVRDLLDEASEAGFLLIEQVDGGDAPASAETVLESTDDAPGARDALRLRYVYDRYREVIYDAVTPDRRQVLHRRVAESIEATYLADDDWAAELARHFHLGGAPKKAWGHARRAAHHAAKKGAVYIATEAMALALRAAADATLEVPASELEFYADLCVQSGRFEVASATYDDCVSLTPGRSDALRILGKKSECNMRKGDFAHAAKPLEELLASLGDGLPDAPVTYGARLAWNLLRVLAIGALPSLRRAEPAVGPQAELDELAARAWQKLGEVYAYMSPVKSLYALSRGAILASRLGPGPVTASCYGLVGYAAASAGLTSLGRPYVRSARAWAHLQPPQDRVFALAMCVGESLFAGRVASEIDLVHDALEAALQARDVSRTSFGLVFAEAALRAVGHFDAARALAHAVRRIGEISGHEQLASYGPMFAAISGIAAGDLPIDSASVFERAADSAVKRGDVMMELAARIHGPLALARKDAGYVPPVDELLALGDRWLGGRYVTASASPTSALMAGLVYATVRSSPDSEAVERVVQFAQRAERPCAVQAHEAPLFHGARAALQAWLGQSVEAERSLERCGRALAGSGFFYARGIVEALLAEAAPGWREKAARMLPAPTSAAEASRATAVRVNLQLEGLSL